MNNAIIIVILMFAFTPVFCQDISYNKEFEVNTYTTDGQVAPSVCGVLDGGFVICWESYGQDSSDDGIYAQKFTNNGIKVASEFHVNTSTTGHQGRPNICSLEDGGFVIIWENWELDGIYAQIYDDKGIKVGGELIVNKDSGGSGYPSISGIIGGGFVVCWNNYEGYYDITYAQIYDENGVKQGDKLQPSNYESSTMPSVSGLKNGGFIISYHSLTSAFSYETFAQLYNGKGEKIGDEFKVNTNTDHFQFNSRNCGLVNGGFVISWQSYGQDGSDYGIYAQMYNGNGEQVGDEFRVNTYTEGAQNNPRISSLANGGFVICWNNRAQIYSEYGIKVGSEFRAMWCQSVSSLSNSEIVLAGKVDYKEGDGYDIRGKYYLSEPIEHNLTEFEILTPEYDATIDSPSPQFTWNQATEAHINFPWELTYNLYLDTDDLLTTPIIISDIQDTTYQIDSLTQGRTYFWKVLARNIAGDSLWSSNVNGFYIDDDATDVEKPDEDLLPTEFIVEQNYPNPFNPSTKIKYSIPVGQTNYHVVIKVYDVLGRMIKELVNTNQQPGNYEVEFNASGLTSGIYFYTIQAGKFNVTKKMILMR